MIDIILRSRTWIAIEGRLMRLTTLRGECSRNGLILKIEMI
jgi:hypothetical protein